MYLVAIAWLYVLTLVSVMQPTVFRGIVTFIGAGLLPLALFLYLVGTPQRRRSRAEAQDIAASDDASTSQAPDATSAGSDAGVTQKDDLRSR